MKALWCWHCRMDIPMQDEEEGLTALRLYGESFKSRSARMLREESMRPLPDYNKEVTGMEETQPNAIMHHKIAQYGPSCESCRQAYRTPKAYFCATC